MKGTELRDRVAIHFAKYEWQKDRRWKDEPVDTRATGRFAKWLGVSLRTVQRAYGADEVPIYMKTHIRLLDWAEDEGVTLPIELTPPASPD